MTFPSIALIVIIQAGLIYMDLKSGWRRITQLRRMIAQLEAVCVHSTETSHHTPYRASDLTNKKALQEQWDRLWVALVFCTCEARRTMRFLFKTIFICGALAGVGIGCRWFWVNRLVYHPVQAEVVDRLWTCEVGYPNSSGIRRQDQILGKTWTWGRDLPIRCPEMGLDDGTMARRVTFYVLAEALTANPVIRPGERFYAIVRSDARTSLSGGDAFEVRGETIANKPEVPFTSVARATDGRLWPQSANWSAVLLP